MKNTNFDVYGMTCSSCSAHVEKAVKTLSGVEKVNVNLLSNSMMVQYNESIVNDEKIIKSVKDAGYDAKVKGKENKKDAKEDDNKKNIKSMKKRLITSICFLIPLMYIAMYNMLNEIFKLPIPDLINKTFSGSNNSLIFAFTQLLLVLPIIYVNRNYFIVGFKRLFKGSPNMDSLIALGSMASTLYGIFAIYMISYGLGYGDINLVDKYRMDLYFESAGTILTLITFGKYLETKSKSKTSDAITKLMNLAPKTAIVLKDNEEKEIAVEEIKKEDIIIIKPGSIIPVDGIIIEGSASIDESTITGESIPILKSKEDKVISGTINKNGYLKVKAIKIGEDTTLSQIIKLVEEASNSKAPISKLADKVSGIFVPIVILISLISGITWLALGQSFEFALSTAIAVLVISCPCALGLATPVAIMVGTGRGATKGILIKSAESLEMLHKIDTIVLDKTGTLTEGKPKVIDIILNEKLTNEINTKQLLKLAASLENNSEHPLAEAIIEKSKEEKIELLNVEEFVSIAGKGIKGKIENKTYIIGNLSFVKENSINICDKDEKSKEYLEKGKTVLYVSDEKEILGIIVVADTIKEDSKEAVELLKNKKIEVIMLTGDNKLVADSIGNELGINKIIAEVLPADKEAKIKELQNTGRKVLFVGDGINDSPALARADVGMAIGSGTDIAIESADIVLMKNKMKNIVAAIELSKAVIQNIKMNLFWAFFYNAIGIPIAAGVFYFSLGLKLNPMLGALAMSLSSVCVVTNALRLRFFRPSYEKKEEILKEKMKEKVEKMNSVTKKISIHGMQCNHCKMAVEKVLNSIEGINEVVVNLEEKNAIIKCDENLDNEIIINAITNEGFEVKGIE